MSVDLYGFVMKKETQGKCMKDLLEKNVVQMKFNLKVEIIWIPRLSCPYKAELLRNKINV